METFSRISREARVAPSGPNQALKIFNMGTNLSRFGAERQE